MSKRNFANNRPGNRCAAKRDNKRRQQVRAMVRGALAVHEPNPVEAFRPPKIEGDGLDFTAEELGMESTCTFLATVDEIGAPDGPRYMDPEYCYNGCDNLDDMETFDAPAVMRDFSAGPAGIGGQRTLGFAETHF